MTKEDNDQPSLPGIPPTRAKAPNETAFARILDRVKFMQEIRIRQHEQTSADAESSGAPKEPARNKPARREAKSARLFVIMAREAPFAVVFRRGPSKQVRLIAWHTDEDRFEGGQWFKGRIYERRCDLSPDGRYLIYFAANHKAPPYSWTAISRPPYLTALAFWPKFDCWEGGGLFEDARNIWLNDELSNPEKSTNDLPDTLQLCGKGFGGEDQPIYGVRLLRDGWRLAQEGRYRHVRWNERDRSGYSFPYDPPQIWERRSVTGALLRMVIHGMGEVSGDGYVVTHEIVTANRETVDLGRTDWADWDRNGDLLFAMNGKLFRLSPGVGGGFDPADSREIADFNGDRFRAIPPSDEAKRW